MGVRRSISACPCAHSRRARAGFTLPEVLAASLSASVLAIAAGSILYFSYAALRRNNERITLQRDATLVHDMISRVGQAAAPGEVILASESVTFATNWGRPTRVRFVKVGSNLLYYANADGGPAQTIVAGRMTAFNVEADGSRLLLRLALTGAGETLVYSNSITMRN